MRPALPWRRSYAGDLARNLRAAPMRLALPVLFALLAMLAVAQAGGAQEPPPGGRTSYRLEASYLVDVNLDWDTRWVRVVTDVSLRNTSGGQLTRLELNTAAAKLAGLRNLRVELDGAPVGRRVIGQTIRVPLPAPLEEGASATLRVSFRARLLTSVAGRDHLWTKVGGIAHMYRFVPWLSRQIPFGPTANGEPFVTSISPQVRVTVHADRDLVWATTGHRVSEDGRVKTFVANNVRDFNLTASPTYRTIARDTADGDTRILVHYRTLNGRLLLHLAKRELARYEKFLGRYPYRTFRVAETAGPTAMESPAMVWIPRGRPTSNLRYLIAHETAHQWFYAMVGNDQARDPFADEALSDFLARHFSSSLRGSACRRDRLDGSIDDYGSSCYYEVIYIQGARFLDQIRTDFGDTRFWRALRAHVQDSRFGVATNRSILEHFRDEIGDALLPRFRSRFPSLYE